MAEFAFDRLLREAYDAGKSFEHGGPTFDEWRATLSGLDTSEEDLSPIEDGDLVEIVGNEHIQDRFRIYFGQRCIVQAIPGGQNQVYLRDPIDHAPAAGNVTWPVEVLRKVAKP